MTIRGLKKPSEFKTTMNAGNKWVTPGFVCLWRPDDTLDDIGFGVVASKKVGNAVARNRAKRRLRALFREQMAGKLPSGDYVLLGRYNTVDLPSEALGECAAKCVEAVLRRSKENQGS